MESRSLTEKQRFLANYLAQHFGLKIKTDSSFARIIRESETPVFTHTLSLLQGILFNIKKIDSHHPLYEQYFSDGREYTVTITNETQLIESLHAMRQREIQQTQAEIERLNNKKTLLEKEADTLSQLAKTETSAESKEYKLDPSVAEDKLRQLLSDHHVTFSFDAEKDHYLSSSFITRDAEREQPNEVSRLKTVKIKLQEINGIGFSEKKENLGGGRWIKTTKTSLFLTIHTKEAFVDSIDSCIQRAEEYRKKMQASQPVIAKEQPKAPAETKASTKPLSQKASDKQTKETAAQSHAFFKQPETAPKADPAKTPAYT